MANVNAHSRPDAELTRFSTGGYPEKHGFLPRGWNPGLEKN